MCGEYANRVIRHRRVGHGPSQVVKQGGKHMRRELVSIWFSAFVFATFWAYSIASSLIRQFAANVTYIDLGALFVLGLIAGFALGQVVSGRTSASGSR